MSNKLILHFLIQYPTLSLSLFFRSSCFSFISFLSKCSLFQVKVIDQKGYCYPRKERTTICFLNFVLRTEPRIDPEVMGSTEHPVPALGWKFKMSSHSFTFSFEPFTQPDGPFLRPAVRKTTLEIAQSWKTRLRLSYRHSFMSDNRHSRDKQMFEIFNRLVNPLAVHVLTLTAMGSKMFKLPKRVYKFTIWKVMIIIDVWSTYQTVLNILVTFVCYL